MTVMAFGSRVPRSTLMTVVRAGITTAIVDGLFSSIVVVLYGSTVPRLWQGVAATLIGSGALSGGTPTVLLGIALRKRRPHSLGRGRRHPGGWSPARARRTPAVLRARRQVA